MDLGLSTSTALVTGSSGGIGEAVATCLAREGCRVVVHGRDRDRAEQVAEGIRHAGGEAVVALADLSCEEDRVALAAVATELGVDVLVANAGPFREDDWTGVEETAWAETFRDNVTSTADLVARLLPAMTARGWGRIVTIGTRGTLTPLPGMVSYSAAKAALTNLTVGLAQSLAGTGVTANCVSPGVVATPSLERMLRSRQGEDYAPNPTGRLARPSDVADAVAFVASRRADYVNGAVIRVDGGITGAY